MSNHPCKPKWPIDYPAGTPILISRSGSVRVIDSPGYAPDDGNRLYVLADGKGGYIPTTAEDVPADPNLMIGEVCGDELCEEPHLSRGATRVYIESVIDQIKRDWPAEALAGIDHKYEIEHLIRGVQWRERERAISFIKQYTDVLSNNDLLLIEDIRNEEIE